MDAMQEFKKELREIERSNQANIVNLCVTWQLDDSQSEQYVMDNLPVGSVLSVKLHILRSANKLGIKVSFFIVN